ncbi:MAG: efflux RND transporter periplasmic adaptor subunit [Methylovirgula sp.]|jgi:HlyD family secretion protein
MNEPEKTYPPTHQDQAVAGTEGGALATVKPQATPLQEKPSGALTIVTKKRRPRWLLIALALGLAVAGGGGFYWWHLQQFHLPPGFAFGNGRLEADPIDIDTKFAGRIAQIMVDEGDRVKPGQVVARMDTRDLEATRSSYIAQKREAEHALQEAHDLQVQQQTQVDLAQKEIDRTTALVTKGYATQELLDQRRQTLDGAIAGLQAANQRVDEAEHAVAIITHDIELYDVNIADNTLVAPKDGRIEYRVSNIGEVLPAGGKVFTMLDLSYVYMDVYLPTMDAGRAAIGDDARIVLDAFPKIAIPAHVTYIATEAQFTPKAVETQYERDRLMFRIRVRIDAALLKGAETRIRTGLPGVTYVRLDPSVEWPKQLANEGMP